MSKDPERAEPDAGREALAAIAGTAHPSES
jgi:hypothetical protein